MIPDKYKPLIYKQNLSTLYFYFLSSFIVVTFEMLSVGLIPIFALSITDNNEIIQNFLNNFEIGTFFEKLTKQEIVIFFSIALISVFLIKNLVIGWINYLQSKVLRDYKISTANLLFTYYINKNFKFYLSSNPATLLRNITTDVSHAFNYFLAKIKMLRECIIIFFILLILISINPVIHSIAFFVFILVTIMFYYVYRIALKKRGEEVHRKNSTRAKIINETFLMIKEIKVMKKEEYFKGKFNKINFELENLSFVNQFLITIPRLFIEVTSVLLVTIFSVVLTISDYSEAYVISVITLMVAAGARFIPGFNVITSSFSTTRWLQPSFDLVTKEISNLIKRDELKSYEKDLNKQVTFNKHIEIKDLSFSYTDEKIINNIKFAINKGEFIGIFGSSGGGKTTLINILLGLLSPSDGQILADGKDIKYSMDNWQKKIGYIPQEVYLLDASIRENIAMGVDKNNIDQNKIDELINFTNLEGLINNLPQKSSTNVGFMGNNISGGQRQRIGIARALYFNPEILIFDEATSSLDIDNENLILEKLKKLKNDKTLIIVSHKKNSLKYCDHIFEIKEKKAHKIINNIKQKNTN